MNRYKYELTGAMLAVGILAYIVVASLHSVIAGIAAAIGGMAVYLAGARFAVVCYAVLSRWAHRGANSESTDRSIMAILWPIFLPISLVVYGALGIVNRVMPDTPR